MTKVVKLKGPSFVIPKLRVAFTEKRVYCRRQNFKIQRFLLDCDENKKRKDGC